MESGCLWGVGIGCVCKGETLGFIWSFEVLFDVLNYIYDWKLNLKIKFFSCIKFF